MRLQEQLLALEEQFWKRGADFYRNGLSEDALLVFQDPVGALTKAQAIKAIAHAPRWTDVRFEEAAVLRLADDVALLTYKARAHRAGDERPYSARVSSAYVHRGDAWTLAFHQQTPASSEG